jgi:hypothetical protein
MAEGGKGDNSLGSPLTVFPPGREQTMGDGDENGSIASRPMRLFSIYLMLGEGPATTAAALSAVTGAAISTIYRDIGRLRAAGLAVKGTQKMGYTIDAAPELAPLFLTKEERTALVALAPAGVRGKLREL